MKGNTQPHTRYITKIHPAAHTKAEQDTQNSLLYTTPIYLIHTATLQGGINNNNNNNNI
jgi:hypothetical protein